MNFVDSFMLCALCQKKNLINIVLPLMSAEGSNIKKILKFNFK